MKTPDIPTLPGITKMTALDLNAIRIEKRHTILTPELLEKIQQSASKDPSDSQIPHDSNDDTPK